MWHLQAITHVGGGGIALIWGITIFALGDKTTGTSSYSLSYSLALLTWVITQISILLTLNRNKFQDNLGGGILLSTEAIHILVFFTTSILTFFIFYETVLIPLTILIARGGSGAGRLRAGFLFCIYTLGGSIPILLATLFLLVSQGEVLNKGTEAMISLGLFLGETVVLWLAYGISFAIKTPLYPFLIWLIHAHTEAPLEGSILLAGVVLKLAIFGVSTILVSLLWSGSVETINFTLALSLSSLLLASGSMLQQLDLKGFVALSSVAHMSIGTLGILALTEDGRAGAWLLALAHGLVSPCLFLIAGGVVYRSFGTRLIYPFRGGGVIMPFIGLTFLLATLANIATPLSPNWESEVMVLVGLAYEHKLTCFLASSSVTLSALYSIWLYNRLVQGGTGPLLRVTLDISVLDTFVLVYILTLVFLSGVFSSGTLALHSSLSWASLA